MTPETSLDVKPPPVTPLKAQTEAAGHTRTQLQRIGAGAFVVDLTGLVIAAFAALWFKFGLPPDPGDVDWITGLWLIDFGWIVHVWLSALFLQDAYSTRRLGRGADEFKAILKGSLSAAALVAMLAYLANHDMSRGYFVAAFSMGCALLLLGRFVLHQRVTRLRRSGRLLHRVVAVGTPHAVSELEDELVRHPNLGYDLVGVCLSAQGTREQLAEAYPEDAVDKCLRLQADTLVVLAGAYNSSSELRRIGWRLQDLPIDLVVMPSLIDVAGPRIHMRPVSGLPLMYVEPPQAARALRWGKALFDRVGALMLLLLLAPVLVATAIAVALDSRGPVLFRHQRVGLHGREFSLYKFRSMCLEAEEQHEILLRASGKDTPFFKLTEDPRVTRVGRILRRYSLDELPQLLNVLIGDMSLVGPRPQVQAEVAAYDDDSHRRLLVRPGMTGLWQVSGRSGLSIQESMRLDLYYVDNWSMAGDLVILARTLRAVLRHEGAY